MTTMKRKIAFVHASPAAIAPLMRYYGEAAPDLEVTNLLDDGVLRLLKLNDESTARQQLAGLIQAGCNAYGAEVAMLTCSSVSKGLLARLRTDARIPVLRIDEPMARMAVRGGQRIGVAVTFPPALESASRLLNEAAADAGVKVTLVPEVVDKAYEALLSGRAGEHDELLLNGVDRLLQKKVDVIVLAQVSMARILPGLKRKTRVPALTSLDTSLIAIRSLLQET
ncbi:MAG: aspartate/glutamate racemase family protein [Acidobacteria bacterium]|nr:aspartate/glutamate racemase family protein [Acidobacteriota bacterium]